MVKIEKFVMTEFGISNIKIMTMEKFVMTFAYKNRQTYGAFYISYDMVHMIWSINIVHWLV